MSKMKWKQTKVQFLLKDEISGRYYARLYRDGKALWRTLKTDIFEVAKFRLAQELKDFRATEKAARTVETGKATVEQLAQVYLASVRNDPSIKAATRDNYGQIVQAMYLTALRSIPRPKDLLHATGPR
jgi:hypothetical protein